MKTEQKTSIPFASLGRIFRRVGREVRMGGKSPKGVRPALTIAQAGIDGEDAGASALRFRRFSNGSGSFVGRLGRSGASALRSRACALGCAVTLLAPFVGHADTIWTAGTGSWLTPGNWNSGLPNSFTNAQINNGGTAQVLASGAAAQNLLIADTNGSTGTVVIGSGGSLLVNGQLVVGAANTSTGTFTLNAGGTLQVGGTNGITKGTGAATFNFAGGTIQVHGFDLLTSINATLTTTTSAIDTNNLNSAFSGILSGAGSLTKNGAGTLVLSGATNSYQGGTTINAGALQISADANLGNANGGVTLNGGTLAVASTSTVTTNRTITLGTNGGTIEQEGLNLALNLNGLITGGGALNLSSPAINALISFNGTADNNYTGLTTVEPGLVQLNSAGHVAISGDLSIQSQGILNLNTSGQIASTSAVNDNGALNFHGTSTVTQTIASLSGSGSVSNQGGPAGTLTVGSGNFTGAISDGLGKVALVKQGAGTLVLGGHNTYSGTTDVQGGLLQVDGSLGFTALTVESGATLGGKGMISGAVTIADGGILAPGDSPGTLTVGSLVLNPNSISNYEFGAPGVVGSNSSDLTQVLGNLTIGGTLNVTAASGFAPGAYRVFNYSGTLTNSTMNLGTFPAGYTAISFLIVTGVTHQIDLLVLPAAGAASTQFWDGAGTTSNGVIDGGSGTWNNFGTNWADSAGNNNATWQNGVAVFGTPSSGPAASTVTITGDINFAGLMFTGDGYTINSDGKASTQFTAVGLPTNANNTVSITTSANVTATINAVIDGTAIISKEGAGTLILGGANTYNGGTAINGGTLEISSDSNLGDSFGPLSFSNNGILKTLASVTVIRGTTLNAGGGTIDTNGFDSIFGGSISGIGGLTKVGAGTLTLSAFNNYDGATLVMAGTLRGGFSANSSYQVNLGATLDLGGAGASIGSLADGPNGSGIVTSSLPGTKTLFNMSGVVALNLGNDNTDATFSGSIQDGAGSVALGKSGTGIQTLTGASVFTSDTTIVGGELHIQGGGSVSDANANIENGVGATVTGPGSRWTNSGNVFIGGPAALNILNGGVVTDVTAYVDDSAFVHTPTIFGLPIGAIINPNPTATVNGGGSQWINSAQLYVGYAQIGTLNIQNGGFVSNTAGIIGVNGAGNGIATVDGAGSMWVNSGDLTVGNSGTGTLTIRNGGAVFDVNGEIGKLSGLSTPPGGLILGGGPGNSTGTATVTGAGSRWTSSASLFVGDQGTGALNIQNGGVVSNTSGVIGNTNSAIGTATVDGAGSRWINNGSLTVGMSGMGGLNIQNGGVVTVASTLNLAVLSGSTGTVKLNPGGVLQVGGANGIVAGAGTATFNFAGGTLQVIGSNLTTAINPILSALTSTIDTNGFDAAFSGVFSGSGGLTKAGGGALTLSGVNTYAGDTIVNGGSLFVDGSIASANTVINPGGLIGGHGTIGGNLINGGVVSPGNSPGILTVNGNFTQLSTGTLLIQIGGLADSQHDILKIGGVANLGGTLQLQQLNNFHFSLGDKITFITAAGGINGNFASIINPFATGTMIGLKVVLVGNTFVLEGVQNSFAALVDGLPSHTVNQQAVARALDGISLDSRNGKLIDHLDSEPLNKVLGDLDRIAPEELTSIFQIAVAQSKVQTANLQRRLEDVRSGSNGFSAAGFAMNGSAQGYSGPLGDIGLAQGPDGKDGKMALTPAPNNRWGVFVTGTGEWANVGDTSNARGYDLTSAGFTLGIDYKATDHFVIGLAAGYDRSDANLTGSGRITVDGGKLALYGSYFTGGFYADAAVQGGYNGYDTHRDALSGTARGSTDGGEFSALFGAGYDWKVGALTFGPTANFEYTYAGLQNFTESGSLAPLTLPNQHQDSLRSTFGAKLTYTWKLGAILVKPEVRAGWQHEYGDATFDINSSLANGASSEFTVRGPATGRDSLIASAGFAVQWNERASTYLYYDGELGRANYQSSTISGGFRIEF